MQKDPQDGSLAARLAGAGRATATYDLDGVELTLREMSAREMRDLRKSSADAGDFEQGAALVAACVVNPDGSRPLTVENVLDLPVRHVTSLARLAGQVNGAAGDEPESGAPGNPPPPPRG